MRFLSPRTLISESYNSYLLLHIVRLIPSKFLSSASSNGRVRPVTDVAEYLVNRHRFTSESASTVSAELQCLKYPERCDSTFPYLRSSGFSQHLLERLLCGRPKLLNSKLETIQPKIELFLDMGFSPDDMAQIISSTPGILRASVDRIRPSILQLGRVMGSPSSAIELLKLAGNFLRYDLENTLIRNIEVLKGRGISEQQILKCIPHYRDFFLHKPETMEGIIDRVDEMKFNRSSKSYIHAIRALSSMSEKTWEGKLQFLQELGFSREDVLVMFRRSPHVCARSQKAWEGKLQLFQDLGFSREDVLAMLRRAPQLCGRSENKLVENVQFLLSQQGVDLSLIARSPELLAYNVPNRLIPRFKLVNFLVSEKLLKKRPSPSTLCVLPDQHFLLVFVLPYSRILEKTSFL